MDAPEISVYGEAKGEYTRQLSVYLVPVLESYILGLLEQARADAPNPQKVLWTFQSLLAAIPDWNQDKVIRETELLQKECKCDYLEELLTAVFIAHTKVLSAIRLTTKQKKLQITIPKLDHFLHRLLSEAARSLWTNAYLFAETNSIEKQKNLRQVSALLQESVLQAIRGLLPVKSILREYLHEDGEEEEETVVAPLPTEVVAAEEPEAEPEVKAEVEPKAEPEVKAEPEAKAEPEVKVEVKAEANVPQTIYIDTKPSVTFSNDHVMFDSNSLDANEIQDLPFAEAENREDEEEEGEEEEDSIKITDEVLPMDADEDLSADRVLPIEYETLA